MVKSIYEKIGFIEPPFIEAGAATNVTPYIPQELLKQLNSTVEFALSGQCCSLILGGAAGSGKTTITKYYFNYAVYREFKEKISNSIVVHYTITDTNELRDIAVFYRHIIQQILIRVKEKDSKVYQVLLENVEKSINSRDTREMMNLFKDVNILLKERFSPLIYVIDEVDYVVDLINEKDYTFIEHLRHIIDLLSEIRFAVLVLASTKLPAAHIKMQLRRALGPMADRISESVELRYSEGDFLNFVHTRFKEPLIEEKDGSFITRPIRLETRDILEREYGVYFPFTENALRHLYRKEKGQGVTIERLRILERHLAKLINVYCSEDFASTKGMSSGKIFDEKDIDKFLMVEEASTPSLTHIILTPKEEEWFVDFFGFRSEQYKKFSHEKCVCALTSALLKYLEEKMNMHGTFPQIEQIKQCISETKKGLNFFGYASYFVSFNLAIGVTLFRDDEIENFGWDSLKEMVDALYNLTPFPQKKVIVICVEDDFEFADVSMKLIDYIRPQEKRVCIKEEDINNIEVINEKLMIKSANSFRIIFLKYSNFVEMVSICAKLNKSEIEKTGDQHFKTLYDALMEWINIPYDFFNYTPSTERILQAALLLAGIQNKFSFSERTLANFFDKLKLRRDRFNFSDLRLNGFLREVKTEVFQVSIPPTLTYLLNNYKQFSPSQIMNELGDNIGREIIEFLESFLGLETATDISSLENLNLNDLILSAKKLIKRYENLTQSNDFKSHFEIIEKIKDLDFQKLDNELGLRIKSEFTFTECAAARLVKAIASSVELQIRDAKVKKTKPVEAITISKSEDLAKELLGKVSFSEDEFLQFVTKPKTWNQIRQKYTKQQLSDETLWKLIRKLHEDNKILIRVRRRWT